MGMTNQIRRWRYLGFCAALCLAAPTLVIAKSDTPTAPPNQAQASASTNAAPKAKQTSGRTPTVKHTTAPHPSSHPSPYTSIQKSKTARGKKVARKRGQQAIDSARAREIQTALIREHYLQGQPTGTWDGASEAAMQILRYPVGAVVSVSCNPDVPSMAVNKPGIHADAFWQVGAGLAFLLPSI